MKLGEKQELFARLLARLLQAAHDMHLGVRMGEVWRPPEMAGIYAERGLGIKNSNHCRKLAVDLTLTDRGKVLWDGWQYGELGRFWKQQHRLARWGGDFKHRDVYHYSLQHGRVI